jgi:NAD(P)-dependent dehydrogenase (short-subunit alcohol dehydrogenase family)
MPTLTNKVAIITGASSGIGRAAALLFAQEGARLVVTARRARELECLAQQIGDQAVPLAGDIRDESHLRAVVDLAERKFGGLDIAFNNAGTLGQMGITPDITLDAWNETMATNLTSAFLCAKYQLPAMTRRGAGSLIFTSTFVGHTVGFPGMAAYAASKAGLIGLTQTLAVEYGPSNIRVNALLPGGTDTPMGRVVASSPELLAHVASLHALKRIATPEEQARAALFLASDASSFVTGTALLADGGISITRT